MTKIEEILKRLKAQQSTISHPDELTERIMNHLPERNREVTPCPASSRKGNWRWAAIVLLLLSVGSLLYFFWPRNNSQKDIAQERHEAKEDKQPVIETTTITTEPQTIHTENTDGQQKSDKQKNKTKQRNNIEISTSPERQKATVDKPTVREMTENDSSAQKRTLPSSATTSVNLHYASQEMPSDSDYVDPSLIDDFLMKFANYYQVKTMILNCDLDTSNTDSVNLVRIFPDTKEVDVFGRMLKVAISIDNNTPGYHLNFSQLQLYFKLDDERKGLRYLWMAERVNGQILLFTTHSPIDTDPPFDCYQKFRELITHTPPTSTM